MRWVIFFALLVRCSYVFGELYYEGTSTFRGYGGANLNFLVQLLPYNPVIVEVGAYCGAETARAAQIWPRSQIHALEPNPRAFSELEKMVAEKKLENVKTYNSAVHDHDGMALLHLYRGPFGEDLSYEHESSLLPLEHIDCPKLEVACYTLDHWCQQNGIHKIDLLRLELEGSELQVLQASPEILKHVKVIYVQTFFYPYREQTTNYFLLKDFLYKANFVVLAHWYSPGGRGNAIYVSQELFDAYFVRCLGLGTGGLSYP